MHDPYQRHKRGRHSDGAVRRREEQRHWTFRRRLDHGRVHDGSLDYCAACSAAVSVLKGREKMKVGFIGLGHMGSGMARNLIKAGHNLVVYNRTRSRAEAFRSAGAVVAESPGEAAVGVEALITMLSDDRAIEDSVLGPGRALESLPAGSVHAGMSTVSAALS